MNEKENRHAAFMSQKLLKSLYSSEGVLLGLPITNLAARLCFAEAAEQAIGGSEGLSRQAVQAMNYLPNAMQREIAFTAQDVAVRSLWERNRIVHDVDEDAWKSIGDAEPGSMVPKEIVHQLPYPDPLIVFPSPILLDHGQRQRQRVVGAYVTGCRPPREAAQKTSGVTEIDARMNASASQTVLCSTHDPRAIGWTLTFAGLIETDQGRPVMVNTEIQDGMWTRSTLPLSGADTLGSLTERAVSRFDAYRDPHLGLGDHTRDLPVLLARAINLIIYLCARNADLQPRPEAVPSGRNARRSLLLNENEPPEVIGVGYRVGAQLRAWKRAQRKQASGVVGAGKKKAPHIRRSHPHTFRYGPGRELSYVKWLWPIPVNMGPGGAEETTIIPVRGEGK